MDNNNSRFVTVPLKEESSNQIVDEDAVGNGYQRLSNNPQDIIEEDDDNTQLNDIIGARGEITVTSTSSFGNKPMSNSDSSSDSSSDDDVPNQFSMSTGTGFSSLNSLISSKRMHVDPSTSLNSSSSSSSVGSNSNTQQEDNSSDNNDDEAEKEIGVFQGQNREATETPPTPEEQKKIITELITEESQKLALGQVWYFVGLKWWDSFKNYIGYKEKQAFSSFEDSSSSTTNDISPGPIDNDELVINPEGAWQKPSHLVKLQRNVFEGYEFVYVSEDVWRKIHAWYGGGPTISRTVHITGFAKQLNIVNHPFFISVAVHRNKRQDVYHELSFVKSATLAEVKSAIIKYFKLEGEASSYRLWHMDDGKPRRAFSSLDDYKDLELVLLNDIGEKFKIETRNPDGSWPLQPVPTRPAGSVMHPGASSISRSSVGSSRSMLLGPTTFSSRFRAGYDEDDDDDNNSKSSFGSNSGYGSSSKPGMSGLQNLGNTCFMNSGLQCLTKTPQIREYFTSGDYVKDVNAENPLGMKGRLAQAFGNLMRDMWSGKYGYVSPREFKHVVGQFAPQFSGYAQQDSQELLAYLLDGLHEDLNRVRKKPITEPVDSNNRPDEVVAKEAWERHLLRNDSVIVDKFQGQLKSTLECPKCNNISITFDPFMYLSLPLPMERTRYITVLVFKHDSSEAPTKYAVKVAKNGFIKEVKEKVGEIAGINPESLVIAEVFANKIHRTYQDKDISKDIMERDVIAAFELPQLIQKVTIPQPVTNQTENMEINNPAGPIIEKPKIALVNVRIMYKQTSSMYSNSRFTQFTIVGTPFILPVVFGSTTKKDLYDESLSFVKKYIKPNLKEEFDFDISHPESLFPKPKSKKQKTSTDNEEEEEMDTSDDSSKNKPTSVTPKSNDLDDIDIEENNNTDSTTSNKEATSSTMEEDQPPGLISPPTTTTSTKRIADYLFNLTFDSGYSSYDAGNPIYYEDELVTKQDIQDGMYSKKSIAIIIDNKVIEQIVDNEKLENIIEHESAKPISEHNSQVKLEDCLQLFTTTEKLGPEDPWYCPKCKDHVQATKKMEIYSLPEVLVIHLKRFQYTRHIRDKIEAFVSFPLKGLDMSERNCQKMHSVYDLYAVSNHYGGMGGGHYTAFAKDPDSEKWYKCDDSYVSECSSSDVQSPASYVLFYSRNKQAKEEEEENKKEAITEDNNNNNSQPQSNDQE